DLEEFVAKNPKRYKLAAIYSLLTGASGLVPDFSEALTMLDKLEQEHSVRPDHLVIEYAHLCLCRGEIFRCQGSSSASLQWFKKAYDCYSQIECRWGLVRARIGMALGGEKAELRSEIKASLEGQDAALLKKFEGGKHMPYGSLSMNLI